MRPGPGAARPWRVQGRALAFQTETPPSRGLPCSREAVCAGWVPSDRKGIGLKDDAQEIAKERGEALKAHCDALLRSAEVRIEKITLSREGKPTGTVPLDDAG